jgi:hypothetical protein
MDFDFEEFQNGLSLEMDGNIKEDLLKRKNEEEKFLLNIKNEKIKQDDINKKQIEDGIKHREFIIKTAHESEIKRNVDDAVNSLRKKMTMEHENEKRQIITDCEKKYQILKNESNISKSDYERRIQHLKNDVSCLENKYEKITLNGFNVRQCELCNSTTNHCNTVSSSYTYCAIYKKSKEYIQNNRRC